MQHQLKSRSAVIISSLFIFLFVYTAVSKLFEFVTFKAVLHKSPLIGDNAAIAAVMVPAVELLVATLLFIEATRLAGLYASLALMIFFSAYILYMLLFASDLPCSCGGILKQMNWTEHFIFNLVSAILAFIGIVYQKKTASIRG